MTHPNSASPSGGGEPLEITPRGPSRYERGRTLGGQQVTRPIYTPTHEAIDFRIQCADAIAGILGITREQLYALQNHEATCDWAEAERRLRAYAAARTARPDGEAL